MHQGIRRCSSAIVAACAVLAPMVGSSQPLSQGSGPLRVMTYNAGEGTDYMRMFCATSPAAYWQGGAASFLEAQATNPSSRMRALAAQIAAAAPTLVSLQEITRWQIGPYDPATRSCGPMKVEIDMLPALLRALRAIADASPLPVVIAMDANAQAAPRPLDDTYTEFLAAGYRDAWSEVHPARPGPTCCQAATIDNPVSQLSRRTDLVLLRGAIRAENATRVGAQPSSRTADGLWPSGHAGVAVQLSVGGAP